jgi:glutaredoxin
MVMPHHTCPYGLKAKHLLERKGYVVEDHWLTSREETDAFKAAHGVKTTPQVFVAGKRIGGYDDLRRWFGLKVADPNATSYTPAFGQAFTGRALEWFVAFSMVILAMLKLQDIERFATMFLNYDLLAKRWVPYSYVYPFAEGLAGVLMAARVLDWLSVLIALFIGTVGAVSVVYAVYVQKRELKCACVGGSSRVPLGFLSLTENLFMVGMAVWMVVSHWT